MNRLQGRSHALQLGPGWRQPVMRGPSRTGLVLFTPKRGSVQHIAAAPYTQDYVFSPDGKYIAYTERQAGTFEVYVASFPSFSIKRSLSQNGGHYPVWAGNGHEIFYITSGPDPTLTAVEIRTGEDIRIGAAKALFKNSSHFGVTADGRFLTREPVASGTPAVPELKLVLDWPAALKQQ
jgi:hypothetical protein